MTPSESNIAGGLALQAAASEATAVAWSGLASANFPVQSPSTPSFFFGCAWVCCAPDNKQCLSNSPGWACLTALHRTPYNILMHASLAELRTHN